MGQERKTLEKRNANLLSPWEEMQKNLDIYFQRPWLTSWSAFPTSLWEKENSPQFPRINVVEKEKEVVVQAEMPGMKKEEIQVVLKDNQLTISSETKSESKQEEEKYYHREWSTSSFSRTFSLPTPVSEEKTRASFNNGILEIVLEKQQKEPQRKITVL